MTNSQISHNISAHDKVAKKYKSIHTEIYNDIEQERLSQLIKSIAGQMNTSGEARVALDYGCGDGNLTKHLLDNNFKVVACDISNNFLEGIKNDFPSVETKIINGADLSNVDSESVDTVCMYSVLHHIPDYIKAVEEMCRVVKPGGIILIDHELCNSYWENTADFQVFFNKAMPFKKKLKKYFYLQNYISRFRKIFDSKFSAEGDLHVFADDHIDWDLVKEAVTKNGCSSFEYKEYLLYRGGYDISYFEQYKDNLKDMALFVAHKNK